MIKWIILIVVFALIVYVGYGILSYYKKRQKLYEDLAQLTANLNTEIGFLKTDLITIIDSCKNNFCQSLNSILGQFHLHLCEPNSKTFEPQCKILNTEELEELKGFFNSLGKSDMQEQKVCIAHYKARFSEHSANLTKEKDKNGVVGFKLCIVLAFFVCIVLI